MEELKGQVESIVYRNEENRYTVFEVYTGEEDIVCVGIIDSIEEGEIILAKGEYVHHALYGEQFKVKEYEFTMPNDIESIERYLSSGAISGIGEALAKRIIERFGEETFAIMEQQPERLAEVKGISERKSRDIAAQMNEKHGMRQVIMTLQKLGITNQLAIKIFNKYGMKSSGIVQENPYRIAEDIPGVGFKMADEIAHAIGLHTDSDYRIVSGILYTLLQASYEGHTYLPEHNLIEQTALLLGIQKEQIIPQLMNMVVDRKLVIKKMEHETFVYSASYYYAELDCAKRILDLNVMLVDEVKLYEGHYIEKRIEEVEQLTEIVMDEEQKRAVVESAKQGVLVVTGGPGTGKTTIINNMIAFFQSEGLDILLAAPTGRAAKRMTEMTGYEAKTIHRLLELTRDKVDLTYFNRNEENPLEVDVIIIDEMSMVDLHLLQALLRAVVVGTRLIMVGDIDQLPSVGPGQILRDLIAGGTVSVIQLHKIFRQSCESDIVVNAHKINKGEIVDLKKKSNDFFFLERNNVQVIYKHMLELIMEKLPPYIQGTSYDIQVLTPMRKGPLGVEELNKILQRYLNPQDQEKKEYLSGERIFRVGDKVMQIKNNYQLEWEVIGKYGITLEKGVGAFNGDIGIVKSIDSYAQTMTIIYDDQRKVVYPFSGLDELELAYAITVHKSQGSEYKAVLLPILSGPSMLMNRNLLYTAVTRAKKCVTILGSSSTIQSMISNEHQNKRYSSLNFRLQELEGSCQ